MTHTITIHTPSSDHFPTDTEAAAYARCSCGWSGNTFFSVDPAQDSEEAAFAAAASARRDGDLHAKPLNTYRVSSANVSADMTLRQIGDWLDERPDEVLQVSIRKPAAVPEWDWKPEWC